MKLTSLATLTALVVRHVYASPAADVLTPTGIPATSGIPFSTLSFDTTAAPSFLSALSSLISSESTAVMPFTSPSGVPPTASPSGSVGISSNATATNTASSRPTTTLPAVSVVTASATSTTSSTSGARSLWDVHLMSGVVAGVVVAGAVAALV